MKYSTYTEAELAKNAGFIWAELLTHNRFSIEKKQVKAMSMIFRPLVSIHLNIFESNNPDDTLGYYNRIFTSNSLITGYLHSFLNGKSPDIKGKLDFICDIYENIQYDIVFHQQLLAHIFWKSDKMLPEGWSQHPHSKKYLESIRPKIKIDNSPVSIRNWIIDDFLKSLHLDFTMEQWRDLRNKKSHAKIVASGEKAIAMTKSGATDCTLEVLSAYEWVSAILGYMIYMNFNIMLRHGRFSDFLLLANPIKKSKDNPPNFDEILPPKTNPVPRLPNYSNLVSLVTDITNYITPLSEKLMQQFPNHDDYKTSQSGALRYGLYLYIARNGDKLLRSNLERIYNNENTINNLSLDEAKAKLAFLEAKAVEFGISLFNKFCNINLDTLQNSGIATIPALIEHCFSLGRSNATINQKGAHVVIPQLAIYYLLAVSKEFKVANK